ncbi:MAG TPA: universal stress protein [Flavilitoribacter sp.]|nr:universal stress protein [Flavilitoribacter sp.]HMQ86674.1 universal stress protein [Flavilitoribacter sp.]
MRTVKNVMVCLDLTEMDVLLIRYADYLCRSFDGIERLIFVHNIPFEFPEEAEELIRSIDRPLDELVSDLIREKVEQGFTPLAGGPAFEVIVKQTGSTANTLAEIADACNIDLAITGKKVNFKGSGIIPEKLLRTAGFTSYLLLLPDKAPHMITDILVPVDFSKASRNALMRGIYLQQQFNARLSCQHVFSIPTHYFPYIPLENTEAALRKEAEKDWKKFAEGLKKLEAGEVSCAITFSHGKGIAESIYAYALQHKKDLIVIGSEGKGAVTTLLVGSVAIRLIKHDMHIPILVCRD